MKFRKNLTFILMVLSLSVCNAQNIDKSLIEGNVIDVKDGIVKIEVVTSDNIQIGDKVNIYHKTSFGDEMEVGEWKVSKVQEKSISATAVDAYIPPAVGMISKIHTSVPKENVQVLRQNHHNAPPIPYLEGNQKGVSTVTEDSQPYLDKAKLLADDYYKDTKKYTKAKSDKLWNEIIDNINKAISLGSAEAYFLLAMVYEDGYGDIQADMKKMIDNIIKSAEHGYVEAQYMLGELYEDGDEVMKDKKKAISWYEKAVAQGHDGAKRALDKLKREYPDLTPELRGKEPLNYGFGKKESLHELFELEK